MWRQVSNWYKYRTSPFFLFLDDHWPCLLVEELWLGAEISLLSNQKLLGGNKLHAPSLSYLLIRTIFQDRSFFSQCYNYKAAPWPCQSKLFWLFSYESSGPCVDEENPFPLDVLMWRSFASFNYLGEVVNLLIEFFCRGLPWKGLLPCINWDIN